jgi:succinate dehydrogenase (ubiquinone) cytochrome b560 subunit
MLGVKFVLALPLVYHTMTGIRHLVWDTGRGLELKQLSTSGYIIIPLALIGAAALAAL